MTKWKTIAYKRQIHDNRDQATGVPQRILPEAAKWVPDIFSFVGRQCTHERVFVLASGPNGMKHYKAVPADSFKIVVNSMVKCPAFPKPDVWMAMDHRIVDPQTSEDNWWETYQIPDCFKLFGARLVNRLYMEHVSKAMPDKHRLIMPDAYWSYMPNLTGKDFIGINPFRHGVLHGGLTVSGCAVQAAAFIYGAKEIILCGVDMSGRGHWDGFKNPDPLYNGEWPWAVKFTQMCNRLKQYYGVRVSTISPSLIERTIPRVCEGVPRWQG